MGVYIKGMKMPSTGLYFVSVDNTGGKDRTVMTVERMLGNRDVRQIVGSFELVPVQPHGRLIDADALTKKLEIDDLDDKTGATLLMAVFLEALKAAPTIIPAEGEGEA